MALSSKLLDEGVLVEALARDTREAVSGAGDRVGARASRGRRCGSELGAEEELIGVEDEQVVGLLLVRVLILCIGDLRREGVTGKGQEMEESQTWAWVLLLVLFSRGR
jgi:hypothetical protein